MNPIEMFAWLTDPNGLMAVLAQNWMLGTAIVVLIIFAETGFVIFPFLPGDSLLFATGAFLGIAGINPIVSIVALILAAILGDSVNYSTGRSALLRDRLLKRVNPAHVQQARAYFERYGALTIVIARFIPIVRTVVPFVAGLSQMPRATFVSYNVVGGVLWCGSLTTAGYFLGGIPWVRANLHWVSVIIIVLSILPIAIKGLAWLRNRRRA
ncbi:membrane protein [Bordetella ansorpii]|uniref:Membrane protein n=1 Tax=Bordetella ansorpii TaxID=288768 RepID=A0A157P463_9BORD|nr:VTT domain-containing protein [Bordetella ansorpii]SAI28323.1 membrane protein [Bordetella ansorpii]